jgi:hypothetical protein
MRCSVTGPKTSPRWRPDKNGCVPSTGETRLAQSIDEVFAVGGIAISFGSGPSEVEGPRGQGFAIRIQFTTPFADERVCFGPRLAKLPHLRMAGRKESVRPPIEGSRFHQRFDCLLVLAPRIKGERMTPVV